MNCGNKVLIWSKLCKLTNSNNIVNTEGNGIVGWKIVRPSRYCSVCFWPGASERLPTPDLQYHSKVRPWSIWIMGMDDSVHIATLLKSEDQMKLMSFFQKDSTNARRCCCLSWSFKGFYCCFICNRKHFCCKMKTFNFFMTKVCRDNERLNIHFQVKS